MTQTIKPIAPSTKPIENVADFKFVGTPVEGGDAPRGSQAGTAAPNPFVGMEYIEHPEDIGSFEAAEALQKTNQPTSHKIGRSLAQFGVNFTSGLGQGLANLTDVNSWGNDNYQSKLFGVSTKEMQDWSQEFAKRNAIYEQKPGEFNLTDVGWWANQFAQTGTGLAMGVQAIGETLALEALTGGAGTGVALARLGRTMKSIFQGAKGAEVVAEGLNIAKGMKSAATIYGVMSRTNESRMEAMGAYDEIYQEMSNMKNPDGTKKYTDAQAKQMAAEGADVTYAGNMALLPLDILAFRAMVFNPASGAAEGWVERGLSKIGNKYLRTAAGWGAEITSEGAEEGGQFIATEEGKHYARTLGGLDDGSGFMDRLGRYTKQDEFWNNVAGGVIGAPVMGGIMKGGGYLLNRQKNNRKAALNEAYIKTVGKMNDSLTNEIRKAEDAGDYAKATKLRLEYSNNEALGRLQWDDYMGEGKTSSFDAQMTFLEGALEELGNGKADAIQDYHPTFDINDTEKVAKVKEDFTNMIRDAKEIKSIYDVAKNQHEKATLPLVVQTKFHLNKYQRDLDKVKGEISQLNADMPEYNLLTASGKEMFNIVSEIPSLNNTRDQLIALREQAEDPQEKENYQKLIDQTTKKLTDLSNKKKEIEDNPDYTNEQRDSDADINKSILSTQQYAQKVHTKNVLETQIGMNMKQLGLYNNAAYVRNMKKRAVEKKKASKAVATEVANDPNQDQATRDQAAADAKKAESDRILAAQQKQKADAENAANVIETKNELDKQAAESALNQSITPEAVTTPVATSEIAGDASLGFEASEELQNALTNANGSVAGVVNPVEEATPSTVVGTVTAVPVTPNAASTAPVGAFEDDEFVPDDPSMLLAPKTFPTLPEHVVGVFANAVEIAMRELPADKQGFQDFVNLYIKVRGKEEADKNFNAMTKGWVASGRTPVNFQRIYDQTFTPMADAFAAMNEAVEKHGVMAEGEKMVGAVAAEGTPVGRDTNNQPVYAKEGQVDDSDKPAYSTMAYTNRAGDYKLVEGEDGLKRVVFITKNDATVFGTDIDSRPLLDPDKFREGTELVALIPENADMIEVPIFDASGEKVGSMKFGQWVAENNIEKGSQQWLDKVPMIIFPKGQEGGKGVAFVHDSEWYNIFKATGNTPKDNQTKQDQTRAIRQAVFDSSTNSAELVVTFKTETTVRDLMLREGATIPISEANPDTMLVRAGENGAFTRDGKTVARVQVNGEWVALSSQRLIHPEATNNGQYYGMVRYGTQNGKPTYLIQTIFPQRIKETPAIQTTLKNLASILTRFREEASKNAINEITARTGIDLNRKGGAGVIEFLKQFIAVEPTTGAIDAESVKKQIDAKNNEDYVDSAGNTVKKKGLKNGEKYVAVLASGRIVYGIKNGPVKELDRSSLAGEFAEFVGDMQHNISMNGINTGLANEKNQLMFLTSTVGQVEGRTVPTSYTLHPQGNYNDYIKTKINSNMQSINIGTAEEPKYVSQLQPSIGIALKGTTVPKKVTPESVAKEQQNDVKEKEAEVKKAEEAVKKAEEANAEAERKKAKKAKLKARMEKSLDMMGGEFTGETETNEFGTADDLAPKTITDEQRAIFADQIDTIDGLNSYEQTDVIVYIYQQIIDLVKSGSYTEKELKAKIQQIYDENFKERIKESQAEIEEFSQDLTDDDYDESEKAEIRKHILGQQMRVEKFNAIINNFEMVYKEVDRVVKKSKLITNNLTQKFVENDAESDQNPDTSATDTDTPVEQDFWTNSLMINPELRVADQLRFLFEGINLTIGEEKVKGSLGLLKYVSSGEILRYLQNQLVNIPPSRKEMMEHLEKIKDGRSWLPQIIAKLNAATHAEQMMFIKAMSNNPHRPKFVMFTLDKRSDTYTVKIMDSHLNGLEGALINDWKTTFKTKSGLVTYENGRYKVNQDKKKEIIARIEALQNLDLNAKNAEIVMKLFHDMGVTVDLRTAQKIFSGKFYSNYKEHSWRESIGNKDGIFRIIKEELQRFSDENLLEGITPLNNSIFKALAKEDAIYSAKSSSTNFRENGKSFFGLVTPKYALDTAVELTHPNGALVSELLGQAFSRNSMILRLLQSSSRFREQFGIDAVGDMAMKLNGKRSFSDNNISSLSPMDLEALKLGFFWSMLQGKVEYETQTKEGPVTVNNYWGTNIPMRIATMLLPTLSDKSMALAMKTAVLEFRNTDLMNGDGITDEVRDILFEQLVKPELERMIYFADKSTNIEGYEDGKHLFLGLSALNKIMVSDTLSLLDHIKANGDNNGLTLKELQGNSEVMNQIYDVIKATIGELTENKLKQWDEMGMTKRNEAGEITDMSRFDGTERKDGYMTRFLNATNNKTKSVKMAAMDYVINSLIHNMNVQMAVSGDAAMYYKSKEKNDTTKMVMDTYDNISKRLAGLVAPAIPFPDGVEDRFLQVFLDDKKSVPDDKYLKFITKLQDGKAISDADIKTLRGQDKDAKKAVGAKFPKSKVFFEIEGTDAQEYTTWKEHLNILQAYSHIPDTTVEINQEEIDEARRIFTDNIAREKLTKEQRIIIDKVMQPIKPRYFGRYSQDGASRMVYIKTSSFPLIPQLTEGFEIDKLRKMLEKKEQEGYNVRASYQSGNKVGAVVNALKVWNEDGTFREGALSEIGNSNSLLLRRKGWGIQQEVPFKSEKAKEDKVRVMTQLMKLMFGDGIMDTKGFMFEGVEKDGAQMKEIYDRLFIELFDKKRDKFNKEVGLTGHGEIDDRDKTARRLQKLLREEAEKRGYPLNDINALGLDDDGNFNMPLWASSNVNRFESLLNSIVDNAMVKIKFPGYSYVAGTNEGFKSPKVIEEQEAERKSEMIYTKHWNGDKLQMTFTENGQLQKAQVFLPSKFKDAKGKLIDLFAKNEKGYIYVKERKDAKGKIIGFDLKEGAIDDDLLSILTCRIPTSSLGSAATVEIAGFLPANSGDLVIVPTEFTKQKGMDFDVDKEYSYHYHHAVSPEGRIVKVDKLYESKSLETSIKEMEDLKEQLGKELGLEKKVNRQRLYKLQNAIDVREEAGLDPIPETLRKMEELRKQGKETIEEKEAAYKEASQNLKELESHREKMLTNRLINLMQAVMENPSDEVQSKINKALTIEYEKEQAGNIDTLMQKDNSLFTGLSDAYQTEQFQSGVAGKMGTAIYSLDVVFHSSAQQSAKNGRPITLAAGKTWTFGDLTSYYELGKQMTVDGDRSITEVNSGQQNASVDNAKEKILGKVNLNTLTMDVDKVFNLLGIDKVKGKKYSYYFLSQPILRDYVKMMQNSGGVLADYRANKEDAVYKDLKKKYFPEYDLSGDSEEQKEKTMGERLDIDELESQLTKDPKDVDGELQMMVLDRFLDMKKYGVAIKKIQSAINTDSKGLNKSFFNVIERLKTIDNLPNSELIDNAGALVGDYISAVGMGEDERKRREAEGYVWLPIRRMDANGNLIEGGKHMIRPTTIAGKISLQSLLTAYNLYNNYLPYDSARFNKIFNELLPEIQSKTGGEAHIVELKQEILREMKKYLGVANGNGIINNENLRLYRKELYIDSKENTSLASYVKELMNWKTPHPIIDKYIKENALLKRFEFDINLDGEPSRIKYNNAVGESFDEQELHNAFYQLLSLAHQLPKVGNKQYNMGELAQALITYCHLGNMIQEAIQFTKFIPSEYYNQMNYTTFMKEFHAQIVSDEENNNLFGIDPTGEKTSKLAVQYAQHFPSRIKNTLPSKVSDLKKEIDGNPEFGENLKDLKYFTLRDAERKPRFITIYNSKLEGSEKQQLYMRTGDGVYSRIAILGTFGMDEYDPSRKVGLTIVNDDVIPTLPMATGEQNPPPLPDALDPFNLKSGDPRTVLQSIATMDKGLFGELAKELLPHLDPTTKIVITPKIIGNGAYSRANNVIGINLNLYNSGNKELLTKIILHEVIHSLTSRQMEKYLTEKPDGTYDVKDGAPQYVYKMVQLFNKTVAHFGQERLAEIRKNLEEAKEKDKDFYLSEQEAETVYGGVSIYEFMTLAMTEKAFQKEMNGVKFGATNETFWDRFKNIVSSMLKHIGVNLNREGVTANAIDTIMDFIEAEGPRGTKKSKYELQAEEASRIPPGMSDAELLRYEGMGDLVELTAEEEEAAFRQSLGLPPDIDEEVKQPLYVEQANLMNAKQGKVLAVSRKIDKTVKTTLNIYYGEKETEANRELRKLSNLAPRVFTYDGRKYESVEHAYQTLKSGTFNEGVYNRPKDFIGTKRNAPRGVKTDGNWNLNLMKNLIKESFRQNPESLQRLANTGNATLTHVQDTGVWKTEFPRILTEVRQELAPDRSTGIGYTIFVNAHITVPEFFDYILGNDNSETSQQKRAVIDAMAKEQGKTTEEVIKDMRVWLKTPDEVKQFLVAHEQSHIDNNDFAVYWKNGRDNYLTPDKIAIELRATKDGLKALYDKFDLAPKAEEFPDRKLNVKNEKCI